MKLDIIPPKGRYPVYRYYEKGNPFPAFIKLDCCHAQLYAQCEEWDGCLEDDLCDRTISWEISPSSSCKYIKSVFKEIEPLCLEILQGYDEELVGMEWQGVFSSKARECISEITRIIGCEQSSFEEHEYRRSFSDY